MYAYRVALNNHRLVCRRTELGTCLFVESTESTLSQTVSHIYLLWRVDIARDLVLVVGDNNLAVCSLSSNLCLSLTNTSTIDATVYVRSNLNNIEWHFRIAELLAPRLYEVAQKSLISTATRNIRATLIPNYTGNSCMTDRVDVCIVEVRNALSPLLAAQLLRSSSNLRIVCEILCAQPTLNASATIRCIDKADRYIQILLQLLAKAITNS